MRKNRGVGQNRCYHLASRLAHRAFFLDDEEKDRAVALMRRVEAGVQASMSYCINRTISISFDPFVLHADLKAMPKQTRSRPPLAIVRPYSARALVCETGNGFVHPVDVVLR